MCFGDQEDREINGLVSCWDSCIATQVVGEVEVLVKETLAVAHRDRLFLVDTQHFCDIVPVKVKPCDDSQLIKTLERHDQYERYGGDLLHGSNILIKECAII